LENPKNKSHKQLHKLLKESNIRQQNEIMKKEFLDKSTTIPEKEKKFQRAEERVFKIERKG
jgi:hypothetical protein